MKVECKLPGIRLVDTIPYLSIVESPPDGLDTDSRSNDAKEPISIHSGRKRVLIVEDEIGIRELLEDLLFMEGFYATAVGDGTEGVSRFREHPYDLVVSDLRMPGLSGTQVAKAVKSYVPSTPVIIVTGWDTEPFKEELREARVDHVLHKPFYMDDIIDLINELTGNGGFSGPKAI